MRLLCGPRQRQGRAAWPAQQEVTRGRLRRSWREYARAFENYDVVLSPVLAHTTPKLGYLSPTQPFETLIERLIHYASFTPANNASGSPAISLPLGATAEGLPIGVQLAAVQGGDPRPFRTERQI